jgi:hypothetical protein
VIHHEHAAIDSGLRRVPGDHREVTPPERIVQTFEWEGMPARSSYRAPYHPHARQDTKDT